MSFNRNIGYSVTWTSEEENESKNWSEKKTKKGLASSLTLPFNKRCSWKKIWLVSWYTYHPIVWMCVCECVCECVLLCECVCVVTYNRNNNLRIGKKHSFSKFDNFEQYFVNKRKTRWREEWNYWYMKLIFRSHENIEQLLKKRWQSN